MSSVDRLGWAAKSTFGVGGWHIGVRSDTRGTDEVLRAALASYWVDDGESPANYSVILGPSRAGVGGGPRRLNMLFRSGGLVTRSRLAIRILRALCSRLASHAEGDDDALLSVDALAAVRAGKAVLMPAGLRSGDLARLEGLLRREGMSLVDSPYAKVDPSTGELVIPDPAVQLDYSALDALGISTSDMEEPVPGRYQLVAWGFAMLEQELSSLKRAAALVPAMSTVLGPAFGDPQPTAEMVAAILQRVVPVPLSWDVGEAVTTMARSAI